MPEPVPQRPESIPFRSELEARFGAKIVTYEENGVAKCGGMCGCCGGGPNPAPDWRAEPWFVYQAGIRDADGYYYSCLCEGCLEDLRQENERRPQTERDQIAREVTDLLGDHIDGARSMMEDLF